MRYLNPVVFLRLRGDSGLCALLREPFTGMFLCYFPASLRPPSSEVELMFVPILAAIFPLACFLQTLGVQLPSGFGII